jgi:hypothetical protein
MKPIQSTEELNGKTITHVYQCFDELWLRFSDGTFVWFRAITSYGTTELELVYKEAGLDQESAALLALGLVTHEEVQTFQKEIMGKQLAERERREKEQLAKLLAKYPRQ